jgi:hypothetical protein
LPLCDEGSGQHDRRTSDLQRATWLVKDEHSQCKSHDDIKLDDWTSQVRSGRLVAFVVAVSAKDEVEYTYARHP